MSRPAPLDRTTAGDPGDPGLGPGPGGTGGGPDAAAPRGAAVRRAEPRRLRADGAGLLRTPARRRPPPARRAAGLELDAATAAAGPGRDGSTSRRRRSRPGRWRSSVDDLREFVLKPNLTFDHEGARWSTNALGMRDREYTTAKPPRTFRIAFVGDSIGAGWGVNDGEGFEPLLERSLDERSRRAGGPAVEILNFAVPGHGPGQRWDHFSRGRLDDRPRTWSSSNRPWPTRAGTSAGSAASCPAGSAGTRPCTATPWPPRRRGPGETAETYKRVLRPFRDAFFAGVYRAVVADCRARGVPCVLILVPRVGKAADPAERTHVLTVARRRGLRGGRRPDRRLRRDRPGHAGDRPERLPPQRRRPCPARPPARRWRCDRQPELERLWMAAKGPSHGQGAESP